MAKGSQFERVICKQLSEWWTDGEQDDVFWRTHGSGARATSRSSRGKKTTGQYGDICAVDGRGKSLTRLITFSLKRGYAKTTLGDLIDAGENNSEPMFAKWIREVQRDADRAETPCWMLIIQRNRRAPLAFMSMNLKVLLRGAGAKRFTMATPQASCIANIAKYAPTPKKKLNAAAKLRKHRYTRQVIFGCRWESFLEHVTKAHIRLAYSRTK